MASFYRVTVGRMLYQACGKCTKPEDRWIVSVVFNATGETVLERRCFTLEQADHYKIFADELVRLANLGNVTESKIDYPTNLKPVNAITNKEFADIQSDVKKIGEEFNELLKSKDASWRDQKPLL